MSSKKSPLAIIPIVAISSIILCVIILFISSNLPFYLIAILISTVIIISNFTVYSSMKKSIESVSNNTENIEVTKNEMPIPIQFPEPIMQKETTITEPKSWQEDAMSSHMLCIIFNELFDSISSNLSSTTEPLSDELLHIRETITTFLKNISVHEDEVKNHTTKDRLSIEGKMILEDLDNLKNAVKKDLDNLEEKTSELKSINSKVTLAVNNINEVAEQIRILSFNASIEAARAGKAGSGFRIIAAEIKALSQNTEHFLNDIFKTIEGTNEVFDSILDYTRKSQIYISDTLVKRSSSIKNFFDVLNTYIVNFDTLYTDIGLTISGFSNSITNISPVLQLHEITSQEIGNLKLVSDDYLHDIYSKYKAEATNPITLSDTNPTYHQYLENFIPIIRKRLTTERELKALERGLKKCSSTIQVDLGINSSDIELF